MNAGSRTIYLIKKSIACRIPRLQKRCGVSNSVWFSELVRFKLLMDLLMQYWVSPTLTKWSAGAPMERTIFMQLALLLIGLQWAYRKDHRSRRPSSLYTPGAWQIWTKLDPARFSHWQMTGSYTKHQRTPRRQLKQCNRIVYPDGVTTPDHLSVETRHAHCDARLTTEQQANEYQQSHLLELWLNEQVIRYLK